MESSWNSKQYKVYTEDQSSNSTHSFSEVASFLKTSQPPSYSQQIGVYYPCPSRLASGIHPFIIL